MRKLDFPSLIKQDIVNYCKNTKNKTVARLPLRVQFLRLLKTQQANSIKAPFVAPQASCQPLLAACRPQTIAQRFIGISAVAAWTKFDCDT